MKATKVIKTAENKTLSLDLELLLLIGTLGYFVYNQTLAGFLGSILYTFVLSFLLLVALIPLGGAVVYPLLVKLVVEPAVMSFTGLWPSLLTTALLVVFTVIAGVISLYSYLVMTE